MLLDLLGDAALIASSAYLFGRNKYITQCVLQPTRPQHFLTLVGIFATLSIIGTYHGIPVEDALANTRLVGTLIGGIMGGPWVGGTVGLISGTHRYLLGGFTAEVCGISAVIGGLMAGFARQRLGINRLDWKAGALLALMGEFVQKSLVILFAKPFEAAVSLEKAIAVPTTIVTVVGTIIFITIIKDLQSSREAHRADAAELSLEIASQTLPYLRQGLTEVSAVKTAQIIYDLTKVDSVSITDATRVLAFVGAGDDHHRVGEPIITQSTYKSIHERRLVVMFTPEERGCPAADCPLKSGVVAPLFVHGDEVAGTIKLSRKEINSVSEVDIRLADGLAHLLSVQIQLAEGDKQKKMREKAEFKALQAQINPHFLYNTLNTIMSFCRTNPETARTLLAHLATLMQRCFDNRTEFISLKSEMDGIIAYLEIAKVRFGSRLAVDIDIDPALEQAQIPPLTLQPLVENALDHGLFPKISDCRLTINGRLTKEGMVLCIQDNGVGIAPQKLAGLMTESDRIGVTNVSQRLRSLYGEPYGLSITSHPDAGTQASIRIPFESKVSA
ncbi:MAG: histidine kinase [Veillonellaceae bacterium]|nr:histidine kinase [Veillonellaceae bacterium]